ncbi:pyrroloquinoline quinone biosynthesis protein PqqE [Cupriavidus necator]|uniref:pyrroloquinoline quinone biosynthesis protein PqqE n=1 Tax=Cupriavidus necator TaxID=106590 RepID=UPI0007354345|nr:pyrroloquinoline quinone biosynthesis protein PqqE [Cupriavidus necator]KUE86948.1 pyrroloquinoline quinone biosynthesis protein PqqE [Cupriavidus necator]
MHDDAAVGPPLAVLLELTHRCPLRCAYCSNPLGLTPGSQELSTADWCAVLDQAAALGVLQVHFSGGEPMAREDLPQLVSHASRAGLYSNLITSGVLLDDARLGALVDAGLCHVQLSFQGLDERQAEAISGFRGGVARKREAMARVQDAGLALTLNFVVTRQNADQLDAMLHYADAHRIARVEVANAQYYGWALHNRAALIPTESQLEQMDRLVQAWRERVKERMVIDYVMPDYYGRRPKACMGGWAQRFLNVMPEGTLVPCHAAQTIAHLVFPRFPASTLASAWFESAAFAAYRGTAWMSEPCRSCHARERDWGGCRCQALALAGDAGAADPVCEFSSEHQHVVMLAHRDSQAGDAPLQLRGFSKSGS